MNVCRQELEVQPQTPCNSNPVYYVIWNNLAPNTNLATPLATPNC